MLTHYVNQLNFQDPNHITFLRDQAQFLMTQDDVCDDARGVVIRKEAGLKMLSILVDKISSKYRSLKVMFLQEVGALEKSTNPEIQNVAFQLLSLEALEQRTKIKIQNITSQLRSLYEKR